MDCEEDPALYYLTRQYEWICFLMDDCLRQNDKSGTTSRAGSLNKFTLNSVKENGKDSLKKDEEIDNDDWDINKADVLILSKPNRLFPKEDDIHGSFTDSRESKVFVAEPLSDSASHKFIRQLTQVVSVHVPDFWKLSNDFLSGRFARSNGILLTKAAQTASDKPAQGNVTSLVRAISEKFALLTRPIFLPQNAKEIVPLAASALDNLCLLIKCSETLKELNIPFQLIEPIVILSDLSVEFFVRQTLMGSVCDFPLI